MDLMTDFFEFPSDWRAQLEDVSDVAGQVHLIESWQVSRPVSSPEGGEPTPLKPFVLRPVMHEPDQTFQTDEDGEPIPGTVSVGWDVSWGCRLNFGQQDGNLLFTLSISDVAQKRGVEQKTVTADQLREFANKLISVANLNDHFPSAPSAPVPNLGEGDSPTPRELLGRWVRQTWVRWASEQDSPKASWLLPWEDLDVGQQEVDMRIGVALYEAGRAAKNPELIFGGDSTASPTPACDGGYNCEAAEHVEGCFVTEGDAPAGSVVPTGTPGDQHDDDPQ